MTSPTSCSSASWPESVWQVYTPESPERCGGCTSKRGRRYVAATYTPRRAVAQWSAVLERALSTSLATGTASALGMRLADARAEAVASVRAEGSGCLRVDEAATVSSRGVAPLRAGPREDDDRAGSPSLAGQVSSRTSVVDHGTVGPGRPSLPPKPWLILGKGPSPFARHTDFDLERLQPPRPSTAPSGSLRRPVDVAHAIDLDVAAACADAISSRTAAGS